MILSRSNKLFIFIILLVSSTLISCSQKTETKEEFINKFQTDLENNRIDQIAKYTSFPLYNGEYLADQEVDQAIFEEKFEIIFDSTAITFITDATTDQFKDLAKSQFKEYSEVFQIKVDYHSEDTETTVFYIFGKVNNEFKFLGIDMAG